MRTPDFTWKSLSIWRVCFICLLVQDRGVTYFLGFVFEIIVFDQTKYNILPQISFEQHLGLIPGKRVESNLIQLSILVHESIENENQTDLLLSIRHFMWHALFDWLRNCRLINTARVTTCSYGSDRSFSVVSKLWK